MLSSQTDFMHLLLKAFIQPNDVCIDATCGNGFDTLFLASLVPSGKVYALDIQELALSRTKEKLVKENLLERVELIHASHETFPSHIQENSVKAVVYNLGYLPGSDKKVVTQKETTLKSLDSALKLIQPNGALFVMLYVGHREGAEESELIKDWAKKLPSYKYQVQHMHLLNKNLAPELMVIQGIPPRGGSN